MMRFETINAIAALSAAAAAVDKIGSKRVYYCQRCLNHNRLEPRKNHKCECVYANCACNKCILVEKRRVLNTQLHELEDVADVENEVGVDDHCGLAARSKGG
uniref:DM domain-containing protein n=3 Tax=Wuchereria bancrofti TaxID=6293 RepID=A0AAF5PVF3_WUCBA